MADLNRQLSVFSHPKRVASSSATGQHAGWYHFRKCIFRLWAAKVFLLSSIILLPEIGCRVPGVVGAPLSHLWDILSGATRHPKAAKSSNAANAASPRGFQVYAQSGAKVDDGAAQQEQSEPGFKADALGGPVSSAAQLAWNLLGHHEPAKLSQTWLALDNETPPTSIGDPGGEPRYQRAGQDNNVDHGIPHPGNYAGYSSPIIRQEASPVTQVPLVIASANRTVDVSSDIVWKIRQLDEDEKEVLRGQIFDRVYEASQGQIPNVTETKYEIDELIESAIHTHATTDWGFPVRDVVNATVNGGPYPTIVPYQRGPIPTWSDVKCNPKIQPCTTLGDWGRSIGIPLRLVYHDSSIGKFQKRVGDSLNAFEEEKTDKITPTLIDFLEHEPAVSSLEVMASSLSPLFTLQDDSPAWLLGRNVTETVLWQPLELVDKPEPIKKRNQLMQEKVKAARWCRIFNGRLPNCRPQEIVFPTIPNVPTVPVIDPQTGFLRYIFLWGFELSCRFQGGCIAGTPNLQPENFDGIYQLVGVGSNRQPIYEKKFVDQVLPFLDFNSVKSLFFFQENFTYSNPLVFPDAGAWAGVTPNEPSFLPAMRGSRPPFVFVTPGEGTIRLTPPPPCTNEIGTATGQNFETTFPLCLHYQDTWRLARSTGSSCSGIRLNNLCYFPSLIQVFPTIYDPEYARRRRLAIDVLERQQNRRIEGLEPEELSSYEKRELMKLREGRTPHRKFDVSDPSTFVAFPPGVNYPMQ